MRIRNFVGAALAALVLGSSAASAQIPLGSGFTYQGRLVQAGVPVNGPHSMVFKLWDSPTGGTQVGPTLTFDGVGGNPPAIHVADGLLSVVLDFGATAFGSNARWIEIGVDGVTLSPRQALAPSPAALHSTSPWAPAASGGIEYSGGNVGIGTTPFLNRLSVGGGANFSGSVGIGTPVPLNKLSVVGNADIIGNLSVGVVSASNPLTVNGNADFRARVGIGTVTPTTRLDVAGGLRASGQTEAHAQGAHLEWNRIGGQGETWLLNQKGLGTGGIYFGEVDAGDLVTERMRIDPSGTVVVRGGGAASLDVQGDALLRGQLLLGPIGENSDTISIRRGTVVDDYSQLIVSIGDNPGAAPGPGDEFIIAAGGQTQFLLRSDSEALKRGFPGWGVISDARAKHDIEALAGVLDRVLELRGRTFYYNNPDVPGARDGRCIGFVAQEVEGVFPEWVGTDREGTKTLRVAGFEALAVEALRELRAEKDAEIAQLRRENERLEERLVALEALVEKLAPR